MTPEWLLSQEFDYRGQAVAYDVLGEGEPVVLVHGTPFSSYVWRRIARELARTRQVFLFDLLGYGQSEKRDGQDVSLGVQNELLASLLQHWELPQDPAVERLVAPARLLLPRRPREALVWIGVQF
jgi:pimeloyl-ACP methyl ester carboxylesterase